MPFYAVRKGRKPGIYTSWPEAQKQVSGFSGPQFKKFMSKRDAENYINDNKLLEKLGNDYSDIEIAQLAKKFPITVFTDGGAIGNNNADTSHPAAWSYSIQETATGKFISNPDAPAGQQLGASNNVMEITALIEALKELINTGFNNKPILFGIDSSYTINGVINLASYKARGWKNSTGKVKNLSQWQQVDELLQQIPEYRFVKIHSHDGDMSKNFFTRGNDLVDRSLGRLTGHIG
ncbi:ribonuclease HI [Lactobacillus colini]|uniref:ribonuclease H n=1 Tax=Lactobacillus colini TaxID=1819254 RepID=A0ABS4MCQ7_9LACO|nr:ribonuclease H family protein [Lactobacillus colini]MBP2057472.1 ribonuclease HI [Lactobacillus colini]